jgi:hypothetical protein
MSFEITYKSDCSFIDCYYSAPENKDDPFIQEMDSLVEEIKGLQEEIEYRKAKMVQLANEKIREDSAKTIELFSFNSEGEVEVDDELEEICDEWWQAACEVESPLDSKLEKLLDSNWFIQSTSQRSGTYHLKVSEGWDFNINNLQWKNDCLYYDGERIDDDYGASQLINDSAILRIPSLSRMEDSAVLSIKKN